MTEWKLNGSQVILETPWLVVRKMLYATANSSTVQDFYVVERRAFVLIAALNDDDEIVLVRQYRHAMDRTYLALPAGYVEEGETSVDAARRELFEEAGINAEECVQLAELHPLPGYVRSPAFVCLARKFSSGSEACRDEEIQEVSRVKLDQAVEMVLSGEIDEMQAAAAILLVSAHLKKTP